MSSEIPDSFNPGGDDDSALSTGWTRPFNDDDDDGGGDSDYDSVPHDSESRRDYNLDSPIFRGSTGVTSVPLAQYPPSAYGEPISKGPDGSDSATDSQSRIINGSGEQVPFAQYPPSAYGEPLTKGSDGSDGPILSPTSEMGREEGFALREWRRENAIRLQEKEKREKELLNQIIEEADDYKLEFYQKIKIASENNKASNREKQKVGMRLELFLANQEKFHAEANKNYWRSIAELIPNEVPTIEKKRGKKDQEKKPSIVVIQGPKPGKPTDLSRMRQILVKLKHNTPAHLKHAPPPPAAPASDTKSTATSAAAGTSAAAPPKAVAVA